MNINKKKTLEARKRRMERNKQNIELLCKIINEKYELDESTKNFLKNKINNLEIRDEKSLNSEIEEFETEQKFLNFFDGEEIINSSQKDILKIKIKNNEITNKETMQNEILILKKEEMEEKKLEIEKRKLGIEKEKRMKIINKKNKLKSNVDNGFVGNGHVRINKFSKEKLKGEIDSNKITDKNPLFLRMKNESKKRTLYSYVDSSNIFAKGSKMDYNAKLSLKNKIYENKIHTTKELDDEIFELTKEKEIKKKSVKCFVTPKRYGIYQSYGGGWER